MKKLVIVLLVLVSCTGCWNYKELSELGITSAMAISKEDDMYVVDLQNINILEAGDKGVSESPITVLTGKGKTVIDAVRSINMQTSKVLFSSNLEYLILDKSVMKENLGEIIDFLSRDNNISFNFLVLTSTDDKPFDIISSLSQFDLNPASNLSEVIRLSEERYGASFALNVKDFMKEHLAKGVTPVYTNVYLAKVQGDNGNTETLEESDNSDYVAIKNLVTFDKEGNVINLDDDESFGYNFLKNHIKNATITASCGDDKYFSIETLKSDIGFEDNLKKNKLSVTGEVQAEIFFYGCDGDLNKSKTLDNVSELASKEIEGYVRKTIDLAKNSKTDFIGIGNWVYKNNIEYFNLYDKEWDSKGLTNLDFDYDIKVTLFKQGNLKGDVS